MKGFVMDLQEGTTQSRPPAFAECFVCGKQFGSRSIALHEPRCLERWRAANAALPEARRQPSPVKLDAQGRPMPPVASLNSSWPPSTDQQRAGSERGRRADRPRTTTLSRPKVLDVDKRHDLDMSMRRCSELLALTSLDGRGGGSSGSSSSSGASHSPTDSDEAGQAGRRGDVRRPGTMRLGVGPRDLNVPNIEYRARTAVLSPERSRRGRSLERPRLPSPCVTCGKSENPERLHSHPEDGQRSPARGGPRLAKKRLSIQRPVPLKYKKPPAAAPLAYQDPAAQRRQKQRREQREKQARLKEDEASQRRREEAMQHNLALTLAQYERPALGPTFIVCYVCGRQFGPTSMPIHQPQCLQRWHKSMAALPRRKQGPSPRPPEELPEGATLEEYNQLATDEAQRVKGEKKKDPTSNKSEESLFFIQF